MRVIAASLLLIGTAAWCQQPPSTPSRPWLSPNTGTPRARQSVDITPIDGTHIYTLPELVDLAEEYNPDTRAAWEAAKIRGRNLRIAESELLPSLAAVASADTSRQKILFGDAFVRQTVSFFSPYLTVNYTILDFGARGGRIAEARDQLLAANFAFNSVHLEIVFETSRRYYRLLNTLGQQTAAQANLQNADTLEKAIDARMNEGLATLPGLFKKDAGRNHRGWREYRCAPQTRSVVRWRGPGLCCRYRQTESAGRRAELSDGRTGGNVDANWLRIVLVNEILTCSGPIFMPLPPLPFHSNISVVS